MAPPSKTPPRTVHASLLRPRHLIATVLLAFLTSGSGVLAVVAADEAGPTPPHVKPFQVAPPHLGDAARYELHRAPLDADGVQRGFAAGRELAIAFTLQGATVQYDEAGKAHWALVILLDERDERRNRTATVYVGHANGRGLAATSVEAAPPHSGTHGMPLVPILQSNWTRNVVWRTTQYGWTHPLPCGLLNPYQQAPAPAAGAVAPDTWECGWGPGPLDPNAHHRVVRGVVEGDVRMLVVDHHRTHPSDLPRAGEEDWRAWYREDIPYPVRIDDLRGGAFGAPGDMLVLTGFQRGGQPIPPPPAALADLAPLVEAPRRPWLLDDTGIDHPWPLSAAYAHTLADPQRDGLRNFMAAHPDAYVAHAAHAEFDMDGRHTHRWSFTVTDGDARHSVAVARDETEPQGLLPGLPPVPPSSTAVSYRYEDPWTAPVEDQRLPPPSLLPATLPTAASLVAQWETLMGATANPNATRSWELLVTCEDPCASASIQLGAGQTYYYRESEQLYPVVDNRVDVWDTSMLLWRDGNLSQGQESEQSDRTTTAAPVVAPAGPGPTATQADLPAAPASVFAWPSPTEAAVIGGVSFVAALAYWLWPVLKAGPAALFSRVRHEDVLDNPLRAEIHQRIEAQPGIHHQALVRAVQRGHGAVEHHLGKLLDAGLVTRVQGKGYTCYFPKGAVDYRAMAAAPLLKSPVARGIVEAVRRTPGVRSAELARELSVAPATIHYHVDRLRAAKVLEGNLVGGALRLHAPEQAS